MADVIHIWPVCINYSGHTMRSLLKYTSHNWTPDLHHGLHRRWLSKKMLLVNFEMLQKRHNAEVLAQWGVQGWGSGLGLRLGLE